MSPTRFRRLAALGALLALTAVPVLAQERSRTVLATEGLAGQMVPALPLTALTQDGQVADSALRGERRAMLDWADEQLGEALQMLGPEVNWVLPPELRRLARRSAGMSPDPDRMGQAVMRSSRLKTVPDPLRSSLRTLAALAGARFVFIPATLHFSVDAEGVTQADLNAVLADSRTGQVMWRAVTVGKGPDAALALRASVEAFLPQPETAP